MRVLVHEHGAGQLAVAEWQRSSAGTAHFNLQAAKNDGGQIMLAAHCTSAPCGFMWQH